MDQKSRGERFSPEIVHLRAGGSSLVLRASGREMPVVAYWGQDIGDVSKAELQSLCVARQPPVDEADGPTAATTPGIVLLESDGWLGRPGLVGHRGDGSAWAPRLRVVSIELGEGVEPLPMTLGPGAGEASGPSVAVSGSGALTYRLADDEAELALELVVELTPEGLLRLRASLTNTHPAAPYELEELSLALPLPLGADEILDFTGRWGREREPQRTPVRMGCHLREGRRGRTGFDAPMMMYCGPHSFDFGHGEVWGLHVAHSGNHRTWIERVPTGAQVIAGGELLLPGEIVLGPRGTYDTPWIYAQYADGGLDEAARQIHRWERSLPAHPDVTPRPVALNVWEAVYFNHDLDTLKRLADRAEQIGVERYIIDDGWFLRRRDERRGLGDWTVDPDVWPAGLHPLVEHVRGLGMQFGLWFEPEMVSVDSEVARAHPEWILRARRDLPIEKRWQQVLNLTIPEAWEHVRAQMDAVISEYHVDYLKWDHNRDLIDAGDYRDAVGRAVVHEQTLAGYRLMDRLRGDHPGLEIEACSSGGARIDLEMVRHAQRFWVSDCIDPHERQSIQRWTAQVLAPELMGTHVASERSHTTGRVHDLSFRAGTALWGHFGFEVDLLSVGGRDLGILAEWVDYYKRHRELLLSGDIVRRNVADGSLWLHGVVSPSRHWALFELTSRGRSPISPRGMMALPGLEGGRDYRARPVLIGDGPAGLILPDWAGDDGEGMIMDGAVLGLAGLHTPMLFPDQVLLIEVLEVMVGQE